MDSYTYRDYLTDGRRMMSSNPALAEAFVPPETDRRELHAVPDHGSEEAGTMAEVVDLSEVREKAAAVTAADIGAGSEAGTDGTVETGENQEDSAEKPSDGMLKTAARAIKAAAGESIDSIYKRRGGGGWVIREYLKKQEAKATHDRGCDCYYCRS